MISLTIVLRDEVHLAMQLDVKEAEYEQVRTCSAKRGVILRVHGAVEQKETPPRQQEAAEMRTVVWLDALSVEMDDHGMVVIVG